MIPDEGVGEYTEVLQKKGSFLVHTMKFKRAKT